MPRKAFVADLHEAANDRTIANVSGVEAGAEDGTVTFQYALPDQAGVVTIQVLVSGK